MKAKCPASRLKKFHPTVALVWEQAGNRVCSEVEIVQHGGEREVEAGFRETRKRRRRPMQMRAWSAFPGKWLCMLSHSWPEPPGRGFWTQFHKDHPTYVHVYVHAHASAYISTHLKRLLLVCHSKTSWP